MFYADLHIHSKYSRATSRDADLEHMALWARKKGVSVLGTGDFTHPAWFAEIQEKLLPAEPGLFRLRDDLQREADRQSAVPGGPPMRFMLEVEISTIYKKGDRTRKVHHLIYVPDLEKAGRLIEKLSRIGNLKSDGRPILGLDSRDLLEITLECGEGCYLVPAHIWTPWFAVLGSKSGFDTVEDCYGDLSSNIFALETGLSSDPPMNWRLSQLDDYRLVSNSDAHSPPKIGREACAFETELDYFAIRRALETGEGYAGTVEFFPEEGKYHLDGHRKCGVRLSPEETRENEGLCPVCGKDLTVGVMNRVNELADREDGFQPEATDKYRSFVPLPEVIAETRGVGPKTKQVAQAYEELIGRVGSELFILEQAPPEEIRRAGAPLVAEALTRMREGRVIRDAGYDGEYGTIRLFEQGELSRGAGTSLLFEMPKEHTDVGAGEEERGRGGESNNREHGGETVPSPPLPLFPSPSPELDPDQLAAAEIIEGPLMIIAGPGTGKTRTLTHRIAHIIAERGVLPEQCLAITFSRRAAEEMRNRLAQLLPDAGHRVPAMTLHALGLLILREHAGSVGLPDSFRVAAETQRQQLLMDAAKLSERPAKRALKEISQTKRCGAEVDRASDLGQVFSLYQRCLRDQGLVDFDDLIALPTTRLESSSDLATAYRQRWPWISVDEFQDIDEGQYRLIQRLSTPGGNLCVIGDPDQAIYGFRGSDARSFQRFAEDFPTARTVQLTRNYRSSRPIVDAAMQVIAPSTLVEDRELQAHSTARDLIHVEACPTDRAEAEFVVHTIERMIGGSSFFSRDSGRVEDGDGHELSFADFAVVYRTEAQAEPLIEALDRSGIPFQKKSHSALHGEPAVAAMIEFMDGRLKVYGEESAGPPETTDLLKQAADTVWDQHPEAATFLTQLYPLAEDHADDPAAFLAELALGADVDLWDPRADRVSLLTLHASKGLEFPVVFLVGCEDGLLPLRFGGSSDGSLAEERRLFFVGMTRAGQRLFLSHAAKRLWRGKVRETTVSPFVQPIQDDLLQLGEREVPRKNRPDATQLPLF